MFGVKSCPVLINRLIFMSCLEFYSGPILKTELLALTTVHSSEQNPLLSAHSVWTGIISRTQQGSENISYAIQCLRKFGLWKASHIWEDDDEMYKLTP